MNCMNYHNMKYEYFKIISHRRFTTEEVKIIILIIFHNFNSISLRTIITTF